MRLTLRTLLAYLDGVLEPADREDLHEQIEASEFARDLIHRTRDVSRRLRLGTPEPLGEGPIDDPNTMAEYLDNTLPIESVPEFERHCLESDVILAEAAASHHVLAMVLGRPAEIDPETRERIHSLPVVLRDAEKKRIDPPHGAASEKVASRTMPAAAADGVEASEGLPDYLRESQRGALLRWMPAIAALLLLCATAYLTFFQRGETVAKESQPLAATEEPASQPDFEGIAEPPPVVESEIEETSVQPSEASTAEAADPQPSEPSEPRAEQPTETVIQPETAGEPEEEPVESSQVGVTEPTPPAIDDPAGVEETVSTEEEPAPPNAADEPTPEPIETAYVDAGRFVGPNDCLLTVESAPDVWYRVALDAPIEFGNRLMTLPTYRGEIALANGLTVTLVGLTEVSFVNPERGGEPIALQMRYGRVVISNTGPQRGAIRMVIGGEESVFELQPKSSFAVESDRPYRAGFDVLNVSPDAVTWIYAPEAGLVWNHDGLRLNIDTGKQWELTAQGGLAAFTDFQGDPGWIESLRLTPWDEQASPLLARSVSIDQEVWPQLREVVDGEAFKEVRALAARCGAAVSHPDPLAASFSDEAQRPVWADNLAELRRLASRSTIGAELVLRSLREQHGEMLAEDLFLMVRGFGEEEVGLGREDLERDALARILDWLGSDALASRVLANLNLEELTGRQGVFRPMDSPTRRRQAIRRLRKWFNDNELRVGAFEG